MPDNFYQIKPLEEWKGTETGGILHNHVGVASLNVVPSSFAHLIVFPYDESPVKATDMKPDDLWHLLDLLYQAKDKLVGILHEDPEQIFAVYRRWAEDPKLNNDRFQVRPTLERVAKDMMIGTYIGHGQRFENIGGTAGRLVKQYHEQFVPRYGAELRGCGEALFEYLDQLRQDELKLRR
ncbi:hypothetical protein KY359_03240 [Candidatus Woesearchaeota archaeon]|nr:hypothetical protein [Candidatus Woesearchaeota archaeon]